LQNVVVRGQETQLDALRRKMKDTETQRDKANAQLGKMIGDLEIDAAL
jgi:hypothetical protein